MKPDAQPHGDRARELRRLHRRGVHLEAAARHRRLHHVRPLHQRVPRSRHRQAARPPRDRAEDRRGHGRHAAPRRCRRRSAPWPRSPSASNSLFERITPEEVWSCTTCKACDEICPVNIEILDKILDMRRYLSLMESNFPTELGNAYRGMENSGQPVGYEPERACRLDLQGRRHRDRRRLGGLRPRVPVLGRLRRQLRRQEPEGHPGDGQAAAAGRRRLRHPRPVGELHRRPARRSGNEYIFQMLAMQNIEMLDGMGVRKIITQCPHCFNTLMNEYPQLGGNYEVVHHSQFLEWLIDRASSTCPKPDSKSASCTTTRATSAATTTSTWLPATSSGTSLASRSSRLRQRHQGHVLRRRRRPHVDGGDTSAPRSTTSAPSSWSRPAPPHRHRLPVLLHHDRRRREGHAGKEKTSRSPTSPCTSSKPSRPAWPKHLRATMVATPDVADRGARARRQPAAGAWGSGRRTRRSLHAGGVSTFEQLAAMTAGADPGDHARPARMPGLSQ
jgi:ferredoxin